jgi:small subunit ribosomal protein S17
LVISTANPKTIKVRVARTRMHPVVCKPITKHKHFQAHDEQQQCVPGDYVRIHSCAKRGVTKNFELSAILKPAHRYVDPASGKLYTQPAPVRRMSDLGEQRC